MRSALSLFALVAPLLAMVHAEQQVEHDHLQARMELMEDIFHNLGQRDSPHMDKAKRQSGCPPLELYHFAGTGESGAGVVGRPLQTALTSSIPGSKFIAVNYNTNAEYVLSVRTAATAAASTLASRARACPETKFALSGYSKGALVVHGITLDADVKAKVAGIAVFGDPALKSGRSSPFPINNSQCVFSYCNSGDTFCDPRGASIGPHLAYARDGSPAKAASGIAGCLGTSSGSPSTPSSTSPAPPAQTSSTCRFCWWQ